MQTIKQVNATRKQAQKNARNATQQAMLTILNAYVAANKVTATKHKYAKKAIYTANKNYVLCYVTKAFVAQLQFASVSTTSYSLILAKNANFAQTQINNAHIKCVTKQTFNKYVKKVKATHC